MCMQKLNTDIYFCTTFTNQNTQKWFWKSYKTVKISSILNILWHNSVKSFCEQSTLVDSLREPIWMLLYSNVVDQLSEMFSLIFPTFPYLGHPTSHPLFSCRFPTSCKNSPSPNQQKLEKKPCKSWKSSYPPVIKYCRKDCNRTKHFDTLDVKTLRAIWFNKWRVASHAIFFFDICDESNSCFQWLYFYTVLFKSSWDSANNKVLIKLECFNPTVRAISY